MPTVSAYVVAAQVATTREVPKVQESLLESAAEATRRGFLQGRSHA